MIKAGVKRIPSLDGLRAISIILVMFSHSFHSIRSFLDIGNLGVRMFFVISSYLITSILYRDVVKSRFSIKTFYFKRLMRTFPAFYFYLILLAVFLLFMGLFEWEQFWRAPIYLENYHSRSIWTTGQWFVGHTWSLAVEEQFYLLIAFLFWLLNRRTILLSGVFKTLIAVIVLVPLIRIFYMSTDFAPVFLRGSIHRSFETVADALAVGAIVALFKEKILNSKVYQFLSTKAFLVLILILFVVFLNSHYSVAWFGYAPRYFYNLFGISLVNVMLGIIMLYAIHIPNKSKLSWVLNSKPFVIIGMLSYSIYLWQQVWLFNGWEINLIFRWVGIAGMSLVSYYLIEEPFLNLRDKLLRKKNESK